MGLFKIAVTSGEDGFPVIQLEGEVDVYTAPQLREKIIELQESGHKVISVNLTKVEYLDSTALGTMIAGLRRLKEGKGNLAILCYANPKIRKVFEYTGFDQIFDIFDNPEEARSFLEPPPVST